MLLTPLPAVNGSAASPGLHGSKSTASSVAENSVSLLAPEKAGSSRQLPEVGMGSGRSTPCCTITSEDVKQVRRDGESPSTTTSPRSSLQAPGENSPRQPGVASHFSAASSPKGAFYGETQQDGKTSSPVASSSAPVGGSSPTSTKEKKEKEKEKEPAVPSIAERRGFKAAKSGTPLSISTAKEKKKRERRRIKVVDNFLDLYKFGESVMPSSHSGMSIMFAKRVADDEDVVVKVRAKQNSFCDRTEEKEWRSSTEFMLNLPATEGIAKLYEVLEDRKGYYVVMEKVPGQDLLKQ